MFTGMLSNNVFNLRNHEIAVFVFIYTDDDLNQSNVLLCQIYSQPIKILETPQNVGKSHF